MKGFAVGLRPVSQDAYSPAKSGPGSRVTGPASRGTFHKIKATGSKDMDTNSRQSDFERLISACEGMGINLSTTVQALHDARRVLDAPTPWEVSIFLTR
jgi:hypothetical protein